MKCSMDHFSNLCFDLALSPTKIAIPIIVVMISYYAPTTDSANHTSTLLQSVRAIIKGIQFHILYIVIRILVITRDSLMDGKLIILARAVHSVHHHGDSRHV